MTKRPEILAPAGAREQLEAAVRSGADAVYFGASGFNARRNAANFGDEEFLAAVRCCRERGVKAYITLNTLVTDPEREDLLRVLRLIASSGADAVIVQDMAVARAVKNCCPSLPLHASTQMAVHNVSGARLLCDEGFSRIVLARELSIKEIAEIVSSVDAEIEVFVHGAHCMSASGMCYLSSVLGARSGNRGLCAQPCRLDFRAGDREYALSLKDMCLAGHIPELIEAGVTSFKIEGRMKRPEYVAAAVNAYRIALDGGSPDLETLKNVFSRSGFTDGYAVGKRDLSMFGFRTKEDVTAAAGVLSGLKGLYKDERQRVPVDLRFTAPQDAPSSLTLSDGTNEVTVTGAVPETALKTALTDETAKRSLLKFGGTYFIPRNVACEIAEGMTLSASSINALRREAAERLIALRGKDRPHPFTPALSEPAVLPAPAKTQLRLRFRDPSAIPESTDAQLLILPVDRITPELISRFGTRLAAELPALIYNADERRMTEKLRELAGQGVQKALCQNIGAIALAAQAGLEPLGGALLNVLNSDALAAYAGLGVKDMTLSPELSFENMRRIRRTAKTGFIAYGHLPLMHFRCCPMQGKNGCGSCPGERTLRDRRGDSFTVLCERRRFSVLYNPIPLYTGDKPMPPVDHVTLYFTNETKEETEKIIAAFRGGRSLPQKRTAGLYDKKLL